MEKTVDSDLQMIGMLDIKGLETCRRVYSADGISPTLTASEGGGIGK